MLVERLHTCRDEVTEREEVRQHIISIRTYFAFCLLPPAFGISFTCSLRMRCGMPRAVRLTRPVQVRRVMHGNLKGFGWGTGYSDLYRDQVLS